MNSPIVVYTAGVFDMLHRGHLNLLWNSRKLGDILIVGVVSDKGCFDYKGRFPSENTERRMGNITRLSFVSAVVRQQTTDPTPILERFQPSIMTHGDDWSKLREGHATLERLGILWELIPYTPDVSTTILRERGAA